MAKNYGPGSISEGAKVKVAALQAASKKKPTLLNAITAASEGPMTQQSKQLQDRVMQEKALKKEVGGR